MQRASSVLRKPAVKSERVIDHVTLDHEGRHTRRVVLNGEKGTSFLLDLEKATHLNDGDALKLDDGQLIVVRAAPESLLEIRADNPLRLLKMAWHIGNRHTPAELTPEALYIQDDHVLAEMVRGQGCQIAHVTRPFHPESGAYAAHDHSHGAHAHDHAGQCGCGHDHGHSHSHDHSHSHNHDHGSGCCGGHHHHEHHHGHAHASKCGCGHEHHHGHDHGHDHHPHDHAPHQHK